MADKNGIHGNIPGNYVGVPLSATFDAPYLCSVKMNIFAA